MMSSGSGSQLGEEYPRGQLSAFLILGELVEKGSWWRLFNRPNTAKFREPIVAGVDYPKIGLSRAFNDDDGVLHLTTYDATASHRGQKTTFRVEQLLSATDTVVRRDGAPYERWRATGDGVIEIDTETEPHDFQVLARLKGDSRRRTADRSAGDDRSGGFTVMSSSGAPPASPDVSATAVRDAGLLIASGAGTCPCCV